MIKIGYEIDYSGSLDLNKPLDVETYKYVEWRGDDLEDIGKYVVINNKVKIYFGHVVYEELDI